MGDTSRTNNVDESKPVAEYQFPEPDDKDFDEDISKEERDFYKSKYKDLTLINKEKVHCTSCDKHLGSMPKHDIRMRMHPMLRTLVCRSCHKFYNSGEFERGDDGSELYCRWCGQGGQVYCCSSCPVVFCAKCVKCNLGASKVEEIENSEDWNCFNCEPRDLWDLRALCWALTRYCDMKNKLARSTHDENLKQRYEEECSIDETVCCKRKSITNKKKKEEIKKEVITPSRKKISTEERKAGSPALPSMQPKVIISPPIKTNSFVPQHGIQVKKFAMAMGDNKLTLHPSVVVDDKPKKAAKRPASPNNVTMPAGPVKMYSPVPTKKIKNAHLITPPVKINKVNKPAGKYYHPPIAPRPFNGHQSAVRYPTQYPNYPIGPRFPAQVQHKSPRYTNQMTFANDNINLSLESLTQGLDMSAMTSAAASPGVGTSAGSSTNFGISYPPSMEQGVEDEVLCTPDFMEPICEVLEEGVDDDVECITPNVTPAPPKPASASAPALSVSQLAAAVHRSYSPDNIVQMTEQDVTVNKETGGLKFKVDPQTLSSQKMYRLPDGRIFAINVNPNMPGGYSATIVALAPDNLQNSLRSPSVPSNRVTFPAKITTVVSKEPPALTPRILNSMLMDPSGVRRVPQSTPKTNPSLLRKSQPVKVTESNSPKQKDMKTSVEWLRYNLIDAVDLMEYVLKRLKKMDTNAQISELRTKSVEEMKTLHRQLDQLLKTSATRFGEVRNNLDDGLKEWLRQKAANSEHHDDDDDDDVEILSDDGRDEPIFIDENSNDSLLTDDQQPKIVSTKSVNSSDTLNETGSDSPNVDPLSNVDAATNSTKSNDELMNNSTSKSPTKNDDSSNIISQIFFDDEDNTNIIINSSDTSVIETEEKNESRKSDDKCLEDNSVDGTESGREKKYLPDEVAESIEETPNSVNDEKSSVDRDSKSDEEGQVTEITEENIVTPEADVEEAKSVNEERTSADEETKPVDDEVISPDSKPKSIDGNSSVDDGEPESVDEEMRSADSEPETGDEEIKLTYDESDSVDKDIKFSDRDTKSIDEDMTSANEELKTNENGTMSEKPESAKESIVPPQGIEETETCDDDKILLEEEADKLEDRQEESLDDKITEAEEDDLLSSTDDVPETNAGPNDNTETNGIRKTNRNTSKDAASSSDKVDSDVPISDELIDNLLGNNDNSNLRSELEKFAEGALDTVDLVQPEFV